jgi:hypothetical protein
VADLLRLSLRNLIDLRWQYEVRAEFEEHLFWGITPQDWKALPPRTGPRPDIIRIPQGGSGNGRWMSSRKCQLKLTRVIREHDLNLYQVAAMIGLDGPALASVYTSNRTTKVIAHALDQLTERDIWLYTEKIAQ